MLIIMETESGVLAGLLYSLLLCVFETFCNSNVGLYLKTLVLDTHEFWSEYITVQPTKRQMCGILELYEMKL